MRIARKIVPKARVELRHLRHKTETRNPKQLLDLPRAPEAPVYLLEENGEDGAKHDRPGEPDKGEELRRGGTGPVRHLRGRDHPCISLNELLLLLGFLQPHEEVLIEQAVCCGLTLELT